MSTRGKIALAGSKRSLYAFFVLCGFTVHPSWGADVDRVLQGDGAVVASRGGVSLTLAEIDARIMELPAQLRAEYLNSPTRIEETVSALLLEKQLAAKAVDLGAYGDPYLELQIEQAKNRFLAARARKLNEEQLALPEFDALAEEEYLAHPEKYSTPETLDLTHILITTTGRSKEDAMRIAEEVRDLAKKGDVDFSSLVQSYTDEVRNGEKSSGVLSKVTRGVMEPEFENAAFALKQAGEISGVVETRYGYHVIKLDSRAPAVKAPFDQVKGKIIEDLRKAYIERNKSGLSDNLRSLKIEANPELVASLRSRYSPDGPKGAPVERDRDTGKAGDKQTDQR
ncbi:peptidylprolyl isomerase [Chiayiivirga flava]|nr:peptidylprolyl isomerase [Chiayiivirga flava]